MVLTRAVIRTLVAIVFGCGLIAMAGTEGWSAGNSKLFTESWQQKLVCTKSRASGTVFRVCDDVAGGKFSIKSTFHAAVDPNVLSPTSTAQFDIFLGGYSFGPVDISSAGKFTSGKKNSTATFQLTTQKCNNSGNNCNPNFQFEKIILTVSKKGDLTVSVSAVTGSDLNGDQFEASIDAQNFVGRNGRINEPSSLSLQVDLGGFNFNDAEASNVSVTGSAKTKFRRPRTSSGGSVAVDAEPDDAPTIGGGGTADSSTSNRIRGSGGSSSGNIKSSKVKINGSLQ